MADEALARVGAALHLPHLPSSAHTWQDAVAAAFAAHDPAAQAALCGQGTAEGAAAWLENRV